MNVLAPSFFEIFIQFLTGTTLKHPEVFGLENLPQCELAAHDFELAGEVETITFLRRFTMYAATIEL